MSCLKSMAHVKEKAILTLLVRKTLPGLLQWERELGLNSKFSKDCYGMQPESRVRGSVGGKLPRGDIKGGGFLINRPHRILAEGQPTWSDIKGDQI